MRIKEKNRLKLISLLIALLLFISVNENFKNFSVFGNNTENEVTSWVSDIPLEVEYDKNKLYIVGIPNSVSVKLTGNPSKVQKETVAKNFKVKLNLKDARIGEDQKVKPEIEGLDKNLKGSVEPATLTLSIRERATKEFKVTPVVKKERLLLGYEVNKVSVSDEKVKISGDIENIDRIFEVRAESDTKTKLSKDTKEEAKLVAYDKDYNKIEDIEIEPQSTVMTLELKTVEKEVAIVVNKQGQLASDYELVSITPSIDKVNVRAESTEALEKIKELYVDVNMSEINQETVVKNNVKVYSNTDVQLAVDTPTINIEIKVKKK